jgi:4-hydroxybenzoate polyprenyltransferase
MSRANAIIAVLRPAQWVKNLLVFVAALTSHRIVDAVAWQLLLPLFAAHCLLSSAAYVVNDAFDVAADRAHPGKANRPFASGALPRSAAWWLAPALLAGAVALAWRLPLAAQAVLAAYAATTLLYSLWLKRVLWLDVLVLAGLYTLRVLAGAFAIAVVPSEWLLAFAMFVFVSLAALKRYAELRAHGAEQLAGRGYLAADAPTVLAFGAAAGVAAVLVLALYTSSDAVRALYGNPAWLWLACPLLWYWLARAWTLAHRGVLRGDPVLFALRDGPSLAVAGAFAAVLALAVGT